MLRAQVVGALAVIAVAAACGGGDGDGGDDDGGIEEATPILEMTPRISRACSVVSPTTMIGDGLASGFSGVVADGRYHAVTTRNDGSIAFAELQLEPVSLVSPTWSAATAPWYANPSAVAREGGGVAIAWSEDEPGSLVLKRLAMALLDDTGTQVGATTFLATGLEIGGVELIARPGGFAVLWGTQETLQSGQLRFLLLDSNGAPVGEPRTIATAASIGGHLARHGDGYAVGWTQRNVANSRTVHAVMLDADGAPRFEPRELTVRDDLPNFGGFTTSVGADVLVTWVEQFSPEEFGDEGGYTIVRVARMSADGVVAQPVLRLQAPEIGLVNVNPTMLAVDSAIALSWSRGDYIAVCGGCVSDNRMHLVLLDPVDLAPVSNVVELVGEAGLRSAPIFSADGNDFAYLLAIDRHARFDLAAAMVRCEPAT